MHSRRISLALAGSLTLAALAFAPTPARAQAFNEVGTNQMLFAAPLPTSAATYATGLALGTLQTLAGAVRFTGPLGSPGASGDILATLVTFTDTVNAPSDVYYFNANPTASTCIDHTAFALAAADRDKVVAVAHVTDLVASNTASITQAIGPPIPFALNNTNNLYACVVTRGAPVLTGTANATLLVSVLRQ